MTMNQPSSSSSFYVFIYYRQQWTNQTYRHFFFIVEQVGVTCVNLIINIILEYFKFKHNKKKVINEV